MNSLVSNYSLSMNLVAPISSRQPSESTNALYYPKVSQAGSPAIQQIGNRLEICATPAKRFGLQCANFLGEISPEESLISAADTE